MDIAINLIGGLGLFLYGMNLMGEGLQKAAGAMQKPKKDFGREPKSFERTKRKSWFCSRSTFNDK